MDIEEKRRRALAVRAERELRSKKIEELSSKKEGTTLEKVQTEKVAHSIKSCERFVVHVGVATIDVPPLGGIEHDAPQKEMYSKGSSTDPVFVYEEPRKHPSSVVSKEEFDELKGNVDIEDDLAVTLGQTVVTSLWDNTKAMTKLFRSTVFLDFVDVASKSLEQEGGAPQVREARVKEQRTKLLVNKGSFICESAIRGQPVIGSLCFQFGSCETFAATFSSGESPASSQESRMQDVVYVWNSRRALPTPFRFHHEIQALCFSPFQPHLLIGGSSQGQIVVWDIRNAPNPIGTSFPSIRTHSSPIKFIGSIGGASKNSVVSLSSDGRCCTWNLENIKHPLQSNTINFSRDKVVVTCGGVLKGGSQSDSSKIVFASPSGKVFTGLVNATTRVIEASQLGGDGHQGGVNSLDYHPVASDPCITNLVLTAGSDWSCRVWQGDSSIKIGGFTNAVYDAKWSPTHPSVFAACDASGLVTIWNLLESTEVQVASLQLEDSTALGGRGGIAASKICWDESGEHLLVGGHQGEVFHIGVYLEKNANEEANLREWVYRSFKIM